MTTKYHPKHRTVADRRGDLIKVKISQRECPACIPKCAGCGWSFSLSTAIGQLEEMIFCSQQCAKGGISFDGAPRSRKETR